MALPPLLEGTVKLTDAWAFPATAEPIVGAPGSDVTAVGVTGTVASDVFVIPFE